MYVIIGAMLAILPALLLGCLIGWCCKGYREAKFKLVATESPRKLSPSRLAGGEHGVKTANGTGAPGLDYVGEEESAAVGPSSFKNKLAFEMREEEEGEGEEERKLENGTHQER